MFKGLGVHHIGMGVKDYEAMKSFTGIPLIKYT